jgi:hypothetical protein
MTPIVFEVNMALIILSSIEYFSAFSAVIYISVVAKRIWGVYTEYFPQVTFIVTGAFI